MHAGSRVVLKGFKECWAKVVLKGLSSSDLRVKYFPAPPRVSVHDLYLLSHAKRSLKYQYSKGFKLIPPRWLHHLYLLNKSHVAQRGLKSFWHNSHTKAGEQGHTCPMEQQRVKIKILHPLRGYKWSVNRKNHNLMKFSSAGYRIIASDMFVKRIHGIYLIWWSLYINSTDSS